MLIQESYESQDCYNDCYPSIPPFIENILQEANLFSMDNPLIIGMPLDSSEVHLLFIIWFCYTFNINGKSADFKLLETKISQVNSRNHSSSCNSILSQHNLQNAGRFEFPSVSAKLSCYH